MAKNPKAVEAFVKTTMRAVKYKISNIEEAVAATAKHTETPAATLKAQLVFAMSYIDTAEARKIGYGVMTAEKWSSTQRQQVEYGGQKESVPDVKLWTNQFPQ